MPSLRIALPCTSITVNGAAKVPDGNLEIVVTADEATALSPIQSQPQFVIAAAVSGDSTIKLPAIVSSVTLGGVVYNADGNQNITGVPAAIVTQWLHRLKGRPIVYAHA